MNKHNIGICDTIIVAQVIDFFFFHHKCILKYIPTTYTFTTNVTLNWKDFVKLYEIFISNENLRTNGIELYLDLTHFSISWSSYMKHRFIHLVGPK